jgi:hypothetical protein
MCLVWTLLLVSSMWVLAWGQAQPAGRHTWRTANLLVVSHTFGTKSAVTVLQVVCQGTPFRPGFGTCPCVSYAHVVAPGSHLPVTW